MKGHGDFSIGSEVWPGLSKLIEECGEVVQVGGKLLATHGGEEHWDRTNLRLRLQDEIGDVLAAIAFVTSYCALDADAIEKRAQEKLVLFERWQREAKEQ